jgi:hypothetical protein
LPLPHLCRTHAAAVKEKLILMPHRVLAKRAQRARPDPAGRPA